MVTYSDPSQALIAATRALFQQDDELRLFARVRLGQSLDTITTAANVQLKAFAVFEYMEQHGRLEELARALFLHFSKRTEALSLAAHFPVLTALGAAGAPSRPSRLYHSQYVIDRHELWDRIEQVHVENEPNVLVVTGGPKVGKSFTAELVACFARRCGEECVRVRLQEIRQQPDPITLARTWMERMGLDTSALRPDPTNVAREPLNAANALLRAFRSIQAPWWIVFDGPDSQVDAAGNATRLPIPQAIVEFLEILVDNVVMSHPRIRLVLTGIDAESLTDLASGRVEELRDVSCAHIRELFERLYAERSQPARPDALDALAHHVWSSVPANGPGRIGKLHAAIRETVKLLLSTGAST